MSKLINFVIFLTFFDLLQGREPDAILEPDMTVQMYHFTDNLTSDLKRSRPLTAERFSFEWAERGYSLKSGDGKRYLIRNVFYVKTFGGSPASVKVHLLNNRFLIYPETQVGSEVPGAKFGDMRAITRVYDLERMAIVDSSKPYRYCEDAPLRYDPLLVLLAGNGLSFNKPNNSGADQPATKPADKAPVKDQPSTPTPKDAPR
jgi:hypothetical protein